MASLTVMLLPAQSGMGEPVAGLDAELAFFLAEQAPRVQWVSSDVVKRRAANSRSINVHPEALSVSQFASAQIRRIGDPLWGDLRLLGEVVNARYAVLPFAAGYTKVAATQNVRVEIGAALIDTGNGNVLWIGYAAGDAGPQDSPSLAASAARALARKFAP
jgi:hypothetical protein